MIKRPSYIEKLDRYRDKDLIKVITGVHRSGKSILLFELYAKHLIKDGVKKDHIIKVNLENIRNRPLRDAEALMAHISQRVKGRSKHYIFIDEIQYIDGFEDLLNTLKNQGHDVYITGSNSKLLSGDINTALRGRSIEIRVFPLSFADFLIIKVVIETKLFVNILSMEGFHMLHWQKPLQKKPNISK